MTPAEVAATLPPLTNEQVARVVVLLAREDGIQTDGTALLEAVGGGSQ